MYFTGLVLFIISFNIANGFSLFSRRNGLFFSFKDQTTFDSNSSDIQEKWITQPLDHFDNQESRTFRMRYYENMQFWKASGPIYLFMNGESDAKEFTGFLESGLAAELANETNGAMFLTEHRYYGDSAPFENYSTENLRFLSSRQALADNAKLVNDLKKRPEFDQSKVVVVGGSYAGNLAAWMKVLYPNLVDAVISSSAPVLAKTDFYEYTETVSDDFEQFGTPGCLDQIRKIFKRYADLLKTDDGIETIKTEENICHYSDMKLPENQYTFFSMKVVAFQGVSQYGTVDAIQHKCKTIDKSSTFSLVKDDLIRLGVWNAKLGCLDFNYDQMIEFYKNDTDMKPWTYQTCTEFGYFQTLDSENQPFTNNMPVDFFIKLCTGIFGPEFDRKRVDDGVTKSNAMYGGVTPNVTNVVFVNGDIDPWHRLGVLKDVGNNAPAIRIPRSSHCEPILPATETDSTELKEARLQIKGLIKKWIGVGEI